MSYVAELARELSEAGIQGRSHRRILAEFRDHLDCNPQASLGPPSEIARQFADQLGTIRARRAGLGAFSALAVAGALFASAFVAHNTAAGSFPRLQPASRPLADLALGLVTAGAQLAFVSGVLAGLRAIRLRGSSVLSRREAKVIRRRAGLGLAAGMACMAGLALLALEYHRATPAWWSSLALWAAALGTGALLSVIPLVRSAASIQPLQDGPAGDLFDDLGRAVPPPLRGRVWLLALLVSASAGTLVLLAGALASDPFDGAARGALESLACLIGFAVLGPYLGLRASEVGGHAADLPGVHPR